MLVLFSASFYNNIVCLSMTPAIVYSPDIFKTFTISFTAYNFPFVPSLKLFCDFNISLFQQKKLTKTDRNTFNHTYYIDSVCIYTLMLGNISKLSCLTLTHLLVLLNFKLFKINKMLIRSLYLQVRALLTSCLTSSSRLRVLSVDSMLSTRGPEQVNTC